MLANALMSRLTTFGWRENHSRGRRYRAL